MTIDFNLIHKFKIGDTSMVLDINSGIIHSLSPEAWDYLQFWEEMAGDAEKAGGKLSSKYPHYGEGDLREIRDGFLHLLQEGMLFSSNQDLAGFELGDDAMVKALCLHVAHDCNLRCKYCFAGTGSFGGQRTIMNLETGKKALDFLMEESGPRKHVEVDYFGGEPLLNFTVVKELIKYGKAQAAAKGKILKQTLTTNAILLDDEIINFLNKENIYMILSIDGRERVHDNMRPYANKGGSYQEVLGGIKKYISSNHNNTYFVRGTYTHFNTDFSQDVLHLVEMGLKRVSMEPVVGAPEEEYALQEEDLPFLAEQYEELAQAWLAEYAEGTPFDFFHFNISLDKGPCLPKRLTGCGAGHEYLAVSPSGEYYPCHQFVGQGEFKIGDVDRGVTNTELGKSFRKAHVLNKESCRECWARFFCSGGCHANAYNFNKDIYKPYSLGCELQKKRLECAIYLQVKCSELKKD